MLEEVRVATGKSATLSYIKESTTPNNVGAIKLWSCWEILADQRLNYTISIEYATNALHRENTTNCSK